MNHKNVIKNVIILALTVKYQKNMTIHVIHIDYKIFLQM